MPTERRTRHLLREAAWVLALVGLSLGAVSLGARLARRVVIKLGPNDAEYTSGFREDWELDGHTRYHWTSLTAAVRAPVHLAGEGFRLRLRARRHFDDPAHVRLAVERRVFTEFDIRADRRVAYPILEFRLPPLEGEGTFRLDITSRVKTTRPMGLALDWVEVERVDGDARLWLGWATTVRLVGLALLVFVALRLAGGGRLMASGAAGALVVAAAVGLALDVVATERILRLGWPAVACVAVLSVGTVRLLGDRVLRLGSRRVAGVLVAVALFALAVRLVLVLHPQFYYPDVRIHGQVLWRLDRLGFVEFLRRFHEIQFRYSLGLQMVNDRWYAMPYPPALYLLAWPLARWLGYAYSMAVSVLPAAINALEVLLVFAIGRRLGLTSAGSVLGACAHALLPLFLVRISLGYFPAIVGHFFDALFLLLLIALWERLGRPRVVLLLGAVLAVTLLTYTQSLLNFGLLIPMLLLADVFRERGAEAWRRRVGLVLAGALGVTLAVGLFYVRYVPAMVKMWHGEPMAGVEVKSAIDELRARNLAEVEPEEEDPDAGPGVNPWRGLRKAARRLYVFYGGFAPLVVLGLILVARDLRGRLRVFVIVWGGLYLVLNLASGGLPGPNLVRYNKDLEIVAPLFCLSLGRLCEWAWWRWRPLGLALGGAYLGYGSWRAWTALVSRFMFER